MKTIAFFLLYLIAPVSAQAPVWVAPTQAETDAVVEIVMQQKAALEAQAEEIERLNHKLHWLNSFCVDARPI